MRSLLDVQGIIRNADRDLQNCEDMVSEDPCGEDGNQSGSRNYLELAKCLPDLV
jgi:hypothetical protein